MAGRDPYQTLGVSADVSDEELRAAYRRLAQLNHPDHNGGSVESARRFEEIQDAYARIRELREAVPRVQKPPPPPHRTPPRASTDPDVEARLAEMERDLREAHLAQERARKAARDAAAQGVGRATDEELGYVRTDDSISKILADARSELADRFAEASEHPSAKGIGDLIDELASKLAGERPPRNEE